MAPAPLWDGDADFSAADPPEDVLVTELDGEVVGYARLRRPTDLPSHRHVRRVNGLAVDRPHGRAPGRVGGPSVVEGVPPVRRHLAPLRLALVRRSQGGTPIPTGRAGPRDAAGSRARDCTP